MLTLLPPKESEYDKLCDRAPADFPWNRVARLSDGDYLLWTNEHHSGGGAHETMSELAFVLAAEILAEIAEYELESRKPGHPLLMEVRKKRYLAADTKDLLALASQILKWGKLMKKKGY